MSGIKKNFAYQSIYQITTIILPLITSPYIARVLGAEGVGIYSYTYSIAYFFSLFALLGIANHGNRMIAIHRDDKNELSKAFSELMVVHCAVSVVAVIAYYLYVIFFVTENKLYSLVQGFWVISSLFDVSWFYFGLEQFKLTVIRSTAVKIIMTLAVFIFVNNSSDVWKYATIMAGGTFLGQAILWPFLKRYVQLCKVTWLGVKRHIKPLLILFIPTIAVSLYKYMDKIMLGMITEMTEVGFFENAERAINIPISIINSFGIVMLPKMSNLFAKGDNIRGKEYIASSMELVMCLTSAMSFGMCGVANNFTILFWGEEFTASGEIIKVLTVVIFFWAFSNVLMLQYLIPIGKNSLFVTSVCAGAVINLVINAIAIPHYASLGAAIGTVFAEISVCLVQAYGCRKELPIGKYIMVSIPYFFIGAIMFALVRGIDFLIEPRFLALTLQICCGALFYSLSCYVYFRKTDNRIALDIVDSLIEKINVRLKRN